MQSGTLFIIATPIGNLGDLSARAIETLKSVDLVLAEDTRVTKKLLMHFAIKAPVKSYHQHSSHEDRLFILNELLHNKNLALVSDAGTPGINDPGNELIDFLITNSETLKIIPVPGASTISAALSVCGFVTTPFTFIGYFPKKGKTRLIQDIKSSREAIVYFDSPHRVLDNLRALQTDLELGRRIFVAREMTKMFETYYRGTLEEVTSKLEKETIRGELVVVLEAAH